MMLGIIHSFSGPIYIQFVVLVALFLVNVGTASIISIPLEGGAETGEYLMNLSVGTPPQDFTVKVTTAEYALMLPSDKCSKKFCKKHFNTSSSTFQKVPCLPSCYCPNNPSECGYQEVFGTTTVRGIVSQDITRFGSSTTNYTFIRFDQRPPTVTADSLADGVFGLSLWEPSYEQEQLMPQITAVTQDETFSMCLGEFGGNLILGGVEEKYFVGNTLMMVPLIGRQSNFTIELQDLTLAGRSAIFPNKVNATIDAGTQYLRLPADIFQSIKLLFHDLVCDGSSAGHVGICGRSNQTFFESICYIMDDSTINRFPQIELRFSTQESNNVSLVIPPTNYFVDYGGKACLALEQLDSGNHIVIGNRIMQEYYTAFFPSKNSVGFAKAINCSGAQYKAEIVSGNGQRGRVGEKLSKPLVVRVLRLNDSQPVQGVNLTFSVVDTSAPSGAMWISHAVGVNEPARVSPSFVTTSANGTAEISVWLSGSTYETTISVDIPLCLDHVIFTAIGVQSNVYRVITYLFLGGLVMVVILLNIWYRNAMKRRRMFRSSSSVNHFEFRDSYFVGSPPQSPGMAPPRPDFLSDKRRGSRDDREDRVDIDDRDEEGIDEDEEFQAGTWYEALSVNSLRWQARRAYRRLSQLFNPSRASK